MPDGGRITILADKVTKNSDCPVPFPAVWIEVEDTGVGIPGEIRSRIFQPFFSTRRGNEGSGLGLASVWKTVQAHGGEVTVSSEEGKGSVFKIFLPLNL
jgi:signal transduction histidine kinase